MNPPETLKRYLPTVRDVASNATKVSEGTAAITRSLDGIHISAKKTSNGAADIKKSIQDLSQISQKLESFVCKFKIS